MEIMPSFEQRFISYTLMLVIFSVIDITWITLILVRKAHRNARLYKKIKKSTPTWVHEAMRYSVIAISLVIYGALCAAMVQLWSPKPEVLSTFPATGTYLENYDRPIEFEFNVPIDVNKLAKNISPDIEGTWKFDRYVPWLPLARKLTFVPTNSFQPGEKVMAYVAYMANPFHPGAGQEALLEFKAPALPDITGTTPVNGAIDVQVDSDLHFELATADGLQVKWIATVVPEAPFEIKSTEDRSFDLVFSTSLNQGTSYTVTLSRAPVVFTLATGEVVQEGAAEQVAQVQFTTVKMPMIAAFEPASENILIDTPLTMSFDNAMDTATVNAAFSIDPPVTNGSFTWNEAATELVFTHDPFTKDTEYTAKLSSGIRSAKGGITETEAAFMFRTIGPIHVVDSSPIGGATVGVGAPVYLAFDQEVDHPSAESHFSIAPSVPGTFGWDTLTMIFYPAGYEYSTDYTYTVAPGVVSINGLDMADAYSGSFRIMSQSVSLDVPLYTQGRSGDEAYSCNIVAARMLLTYRGVSISTSQLRSEVGYQPSRGDGGNPHVGFTPSYGTYWEPILATVQGYRSAHLITDGNITTLLNEVQAGNPVMIWGQNGWSTPTNISYTAADGTDIYAVSGMHSIVIRGFAGTPEEPTAIYVNDPWRGATTITPAKLRSNWSYFNVAMVVE